MLSTNTTNTKRNMSALSSYSEIAEYLHRCASALSGVCDGAHTQDGSGFNGGDSHFGKSLAAQNPAHYSPGQVACLAKMLRKYKRQLAGFGLDITLVPASIENKEAAYALRGERPAAPVVQSAAPTELADNGHKIEAMPRGYWKVIFPYSAELIAALKTLPGKTRKFEPAGKFWLVNLTAGQPEEILTASKEFRQIIARFEFSAPAELTASLDKAIAEAGAAIMTRADNHEASFATDAQLDMTGMEWIGGELMPFQRAGVAYFRRLKRGIIGDEMGLGKTPQSLVTAEACGAFPLLIVCRAGLKPNWLREAKKWLGARRRVSGNVFDRADITVATHDEVTKHVDFFSEEFVPAGLIGDESQDFKNHKAKRTAAMKTIADAMDADALKLLLSGTPIENRPAEFISQLSIVGRLQDLGGWKYFTQRYCDAHQTRFGLDLKGASNTAELNTKLRQTCYVRRLKKEVLTELPDKVRNVLEVSISNRAEYNKAAAEVRARLVELVQEVKEATRETMREVRVMEDAQVLEWMRSTWPKLKEAALLEFESQLEKNREEGRCTIENFIYGQLIAKEVGTENAGAFMELNLLMKRVGLGKIEAVSEKVSEFMEGGVKKMIVFARHIEVQRALFDVLPGAIWTRDSKWKTPQEAVDAFQNGDAPVIVCSLDGDNAGLNITAASYVIFAERGWKPSVHFQAEDRAHRIGQKDTVFVYYMDAAGTVDETLAEVHAQKTAILESAMNGEEASDKGAMRAVLARLIAE